MSIKNSYGVKGLFVLMLLFISGSPGIYGNQFNYLGFLLILIGWSVIQRNGSLSIRPFGEVGLFSLTFVVVCIIQYFVLGDVSILGLVNNLIKMLVFSFVVFILRGEFKYVYFEVLYYLSLIGLFLWIIFLMTGFAMDLTGKDDINNSIIIWNVRNGEIRNSGPFWEPGAYGGYLLLIPLFFLNEPDFFLKNKRKSLVLFLALLSTMSTTAYLSIGIYLVYLAFKSKLRIFLAPAFIFLSMIVFFEVSFMRDKLIYEIDRVTALEGDYHGQRFAALIFDLHYIFKHPLIGNGFLDTTRFMDHPDVLMKLRNQTIDGHGNGLSNFIASMGLVSFIVYIGLIAKKNQKVLSRKDLCFYIGMIVLILNGEQFLYYPIFLGLPFLSLKPLNSTDEKKNCSIIDCS